eukprot:TRINITY_DN5555_c0_g1_i2.p1 TRINITY_DN5555_c0_g1~~TRINITY_DN5555_c0_g1_i2.p1  ORF type:complete len:109 (+),score=19.24 TRINITY_DN5555_c0_g1_i2:352-678(+)
MQGIPNQGIPNQGIPNQGIPNQGIPNQSIPNQGIPNQSIHNGMTNGGMENGVTVHGGMVGANSVMDPKSCENEQLIMYSMIPTKSRPFKRIKCQDEIKGEGHVESTTR